MTKAVELNRTVYLSPSSCISMSDGSAPGAGIGAGLGTFVGVYRAFLLD